MNVEQAIRDHARAEYPREACGVIAIVKGKERYLPCRNLASTPQENFVLSPEDWAKAEDFGEIVAIVHSHPDVPARMSEADRVMCEASGLPWWIVNVTSDATGDLLRFEPDGYQAPLVGRTFSHGVLDCYSLIRDYYRVMLDIVLPDFERRDEWWLRGDDLYRKHFRDAGFEEITDSLREHDVVLMQLRSPQVNHGAIYIGDGLILQHLSGRMSSRDVYDGYFQEKTVLKIRHKELA
jgi:proteasome lid subunit RPN8/RPN11